MVAPTLIPVKAGDRVKTDRRDAVKLARYLRAGALTAVWVLDETHEALRDLVCLREAAKADQKRARSQLGRFLRRHGWHAPDGLKAWGATHRAWMGSIWMEQPVQRMVLQENLAEFDHQNERIVRLDAAVHAQIETLPEEMKQVIGGLQCIYGVAELSALSSPRRETWAAFARHRSFSATRGWCPASIRAEGRVSIRNMPSRALVRLPGGCKDR